jgi:hypothetical protein
MLNVLRCPKCDNDNGPVNLSDGEYETTCAFCEARLELVIHQRATVSVIESEVPDGE